MGPYFYPPPQTGGILLLTHLPVFYAWSTFFMIKIIHILNVLLIRCVSRILVHFHFWVVCIFKRLWPRRLNLQRNRFTATQWICFAAGWTALGPFFATKRCPKVIKMCPQPLELKYSYDRRIQSRIQRIQDTNVGYNVTQRIQKSWDSCFTSKNG